MHIFLIILSVLLALAGIFGSIIPSLPGPIVSYLAIVAIYFGKGSDEVSTKFLIFSGILMILIQLFLNFLPIAAAKIAGASKYGIAGSLIGMVAGIFAVSPIAMIIGAGLGAVIGELFVIDDIKKAINAGFGTLVGTIIGLLTQIIFSISLFIYILVKIIF